MSSPSMLQIICSSTDCQIGTAAGRCERIRLRVQVQEQADVSAGGVLLPSSAKERPISGRVVRTGPGKLEKDGKRKPVDVQEGDQVLYFKYAGDPMETPDGSKYVVVHDSDLLCKT